jgi:hypothetical protein
VLRFDHRYDLEDTGTGSLAWDGARILVWSAATGWQAPTPAGGYSHQFISSGGPFPQGAPCWSGNSGGWITETIDLSAFAPHPVQIRFRMLADEFIGGEGWYVDHIRIDFPGANVDIETPATSIAFGPAWPNPARDVLRQSIHLAARAEVSWALYDVAGRRAAVLWSGPAAPGPLELRGSIPSHLRSGLYFARLHVGGIQLHTARIIVLR